MQPISLSAASFSGYPPEAREIATRNLKLLQSLPLLLAAVLLREVSGYDWKFPAERHAIDRQLTFLSGQSPADRTALLKPLTAVEISPALQRIDWINQPSAFLEEMSAWMWSSGQTERFRVATESYSSAVDTSAPETPPAQPRLGMVVIGAGADRGRSPLFRKLRPHGVLLTRVVPEGGYAVLLKAAEARCPALPSPANFRHWSIDGGAGPGSTPLTSVAYEGLSQSRSALLQRIKTAIQSDGTGPEGLRSLLARMPPEQIGLHGDPALNRFQLSLLTEGSGTQIFSTTFVQWAARECVRRAQPETLLVRYAARQQAQTMNAMLTGAPQTGVDAAGSLIDADMGAYYTWLAMRRLSGSEQTRFLVWHEGHAEAIVLGPGLPQGTVSDSVLPMAKVMQLLA